MGITKQYLRFEASGVSNIVGSSNGAVTAVDSTVCAVSACEFVNFYNLRTNETLIQLAGKKPVTTLKFTENRRFLAIGYADGNTHVHDRTVRDQTAYLVFAGHKTGVNCLTFTDDGLILASGGKDSTIILWDIVNEAGLFRLNGHKGSITHMEFTKDGQYLLSSSKDTFLKFWNLSTHSCFYTLADHRTEIYTFSLIKNDTQLITGSAELELGLFELKWNSQGENDLFEVVKKLKPSENVNIEDANLDNQSNVVLRCRKVGSFLRQSKGRALQLVVSPDEKLILCLGSGPLVDIFRIYTDEETQKRLGKKVRKAKKKTASEGETAPENLEENVRKDISIFIGRIGEYKADVKVKWIDFCPRIDQLENISEYRFFALLTNNTVHCLRLDLNQSDRVLLESLGDLDNLGHRTDIRSLAMSHDDFALLSTASDTAIVRNRHSLQSVRLLSHQSCRDLTAAVFVVGDRHVVLGDKTGGISVFDLTTNELLQSDRAHDGTIWQIISTWDKKGFISCGGDRKVRFWQYQMTTDGENKKRLSVVAEQTLTTTDEPLCCIQHGAYLAVGMLDNTVRIHHNDQSLKFHLSLYGHSLPVLCLDMSDDDQLVVTGSADKNVRIWGLDFGDCHSSLFAHDDSVTCVRFSPKTHQFWSAGKDGHLHQWDGDKFVKVQTLFNGHFGHSVRTLTMTTDGKVLVSAGADGAIRMWQRTEEIVVLQEEQQLEKRDEYSQQLQQHPIFGENAEKESDLAGKISAESVKSADCMIEAVDIYRNEKDLTISDPNHSIHPLINALGSRNLDRFIVDSIAKVRSSELEKCLLMVPFGYVFDFLKALAKCVDEGYKVELASRVILFLVRVHHSQLINCDQALSTIDLVRRSIPRGITDIRDICGFNLAALNLLQLEIEEKQSVKLFSQVDEKRKSKKSKNKTFVIGVV